MRGLVLFRVVLVCFFVSAIVSGAAIYADGEIVAWGDRKLPDQPLTNLTHIAAGSNHSLGLKSDGSIVAWGFNWRGQCDVPSPNTGFTGIAGGASYSLGLRGCAFDLVGDLNNDCRVGMLDLALMGEGWMMDYDMADCAGMGSNWLIRCNAYPFDAACVAK